MAKSFLLRPPSILVGLDSGRVDRLRNAGITNIALLFDRGPRDAHRALAGTTAHQIGDLFCAAMLLRVSGVTPALAAALVAGSVRSVARIAAVELQVLEQLVAAAHDTGTLDDEPTLYELATLQQAASRVMITGMVTGRVLGRVPDGSADDPAPIADATVTFAGESTESDDKGWFALNRVPVGRNRLSVELPDKRDRFHARPVDIVAGKLARLAVVNVPSAARDLASNARRESEGFLIVNRAGFAHRLVDRELAEFTVNSYFLVRQIPSTGPARLVCFDKVRFGSTIFIERTRVPVTMLPDQTPIGAVLQWDGNALQPTTLSPADVNRERLASWRSAHPVHRRRRTSIL